MKKSDLYTLYQKIDDLSHVKDAKFAYFLLKNKKMIAEEIETIQKSLEQLPQDLSEKDLEIRSKRNDILQKYATKNDNGEVIEINGLFSIPVTVSEEFQNEMNKINEEYKDELEKINEIRQKNNDLLSEETGLEFTTIHSNDLPNSLSLVDIEPFTELII
jgi:predicted component of viral defense system (DUF524 family)